MQRRLRRFFCRKRWNWGPFPPRTHDLHLLPVVWKFLAAIQAHNVGAGRERRATALAFFNSDRKAVMLVPAAEKHIHNPENIFLPPTECLRLGAGEASST